ncbi:hypothetical protein [Streptosporangium roseum]|uniref:hypothetical protein n=1 Tax=Streptosporangium roseum TaxID=2001 RepID=UPI00342160C5
MQVDSLIGTVKSDLPHTCSAPNAYLTAPVGVAAKALGAVVDAGGQGRNRVSCDLEDGHDGARLALAQHTDDWQEC